MNAKDILVATDFSPASEAALTYASSLAAESGATLHIVHVADEHAAQCSGHTGYGYLVDITQQLLSECRPLLDQVQPTSPDIPFKRHLLIGLPAERILWLADREEADLIVIGSHGRTGLSRLLMGSVAEAVVRRAKVPVLTVKQPVTTKAQADENDFASMEDDTAGLGAVR